MVWCHEHSPWSRATIPRRRDENHRAVVGGAPHNPKCGECRGVHAPPWGGPQEVGSAASASKLRTVGKPGSSFKLSHNSVNERR
jgi:hypothetical protein